MYVCMCVSIHVNKVGIRLVEIYSEGVQINVFVCMYVCVCVCLYTSGGDILGRRAGKCVCVCVYIYICMYIIYIYIYIYIWLIYIRKACR